MCYSINPDTSEKFDKKPQFYMVDLETKQIINRYEFSQVSYIDKIIYADDLSCAWIYNQEQVWQISLTPYKLNVKEKKAMENKE